MTEIYKAPIFCFATTQSKNYINKNKTNPDIGMAIDGCQRPTAKASGLV
jgi:hypothetical protein